jgi:single-stranded-DNA-specific exonuclease
LNAAGRLDTAQASLQLLLADDPNLARNLAADLDQQNRDRQTLEQRTRDQAEEMIEALPSDDRAFGIVVGERGWHPGVVGIVAARIMKQYHRPTFIIGVDEDGIGKGSGRSVPGISLIAALDSCRDLLEAGGGHEMAAGLSIREANIPEFRKRFGEHIAAVASADQLRPELKIDAVATLGELTVDLLDSYELLRPFGNSNPQPLFMSRAVQVTAEPRVIKEKHLKIRLSQSGVSRDAMYFSGAGQELPRPPWDIVYTIDRNEYRGQIGITIAIQAVRKAV